MPKDGKVNMSSLDELRKELEYAIENGKSENEIREISMRLDELIVKQMYEINK